MAKKKKPVIEDAVKSFQEMMKRSPLDDFLCVNRVLITTQKPIKVQANQVYTVLVEVGQALWNALMEDDEWKQHVREPDMGDPEEWELAGKSHYVTDEHEWFPIDEKDFYDGKVIPIHIEGFNYDIHVNKWMLPIRLKKAEFNNVSYTVTSDRLLLLRKSFDAIKDLPDTEYAVYRLFRII